MAKMNKADRRGPRQGGQGLSAGLDPHTPAAHQAPGDLIAKQEPRLAELLQYNLCSVRIYLLKEDFQFFWSDKSPYWAGVFLDRWCTRTLGSRIGPMKKFARTLRGHRALLRTGSEQIRHFSSGTVAGFNDKAKLTMRKSYGFRTYKAAEIAYIIYLTLYTNPSSPTDSAEEASFWKLRQNTLPFFIGCRVCITAPVTGIIVASVRLPGHLNLIVKRHKLHFESGFGSALNLFLEFWKRF